MEIGVVYPQIELGGDPDAVRQLGAAAEDLGYDHLLAYDHVLGADQQDREPELTGPYDEDDPFHDPFVLFAYLAGRHERLNFVSGVLILPQRQTALVARQAADLALLSGDRFRLGVGVGWNWVEYEALGQDFSTRGKRADEQIELLRRLWTENVVSVDGRFDRIDRAGLAPRPRQPIPIWIGGFGEAALRRCARAGDGFLFGGPTDHVRGMHQRLRELLVEHGRAPDDVGAEAMVLTRKGPDDVAAKLRAWAEDGGTHGTVITMGLGLDSTDAHIDYIRRVAEALRAG
ncbi:MAG: LLM class F420-dependent oxidoreductase [Acidimicrobiales bacterium]